MLENLNISAQPGSKAIVMTRTFDAPPSAVFEAWTNAEAVAHWWDPSGVPLSICEIDLRPNGAFRWINLGDKGMEYPFTGTYLKITPPETLVFTARTFSSSPESVANLSFIGDNGKTNFTMTIECASVEDRDALLGMRMDVGTARTLENLAAFLVKTRPIEDGK